MGNKKYIVLSNTDGEWDEETKTTKIPMIAYGDTIDQAIHAAYKAGAVPVNIYKLINWEAREK